VTIRNLGVAIGGQAVHVTGGSRPIFKDVTILDGAGDGLRLAGDGMLARVAPC
jgi:hypothetical protein